MRVILFLSLLFSFSLALAHGEDKEGPHGGFIRMPGAFHTELMLSEDMSAHVFLLDMEFKNPTVKDSSIEITHVDGKKKTTFKCSVMGSNHFHCIPEKKYSAKGKLLVKATRDKAPGNEVSYELPLKVSSHH